MQVIVVIVPYFAKIFNLVPLNKTRMDVHDRNLFIANFNNRNTKND